MTRHFLDSKLKIATETKEMKDHSQYSYTDILAACKNLRSRCFKNKAMFIVISWSLCASVMAEFLLNGYFDKYSSEGFFAWHAAMIVISGIILPVAGWISDTYIMRYKVIKLSLLTMWLGSIGYALCKIMYYYGFHSHLFIFMSEGFNTLNVISFIIFEANIFQFSFDQISDFSSDEAIFFIRIYLWVNSFIFVIHNLLNCFDYEALLILLIPVVLTLCVCSDFLCNKALVKEPPMHNPLKLIYQVLNYAMKNKKPRIRSAFTYWDDKPYSRIDLAKIKYGGPFTTEKVEDVKTFFRILGVIYVYTFFIGIGIMSYNRYLCIFDARYYKPAVEHIDICYKWWVVSRIGLIIIVIGYPFYSIALHPLLSRLFKLTILSRGALGMSLIIASLLALTTMEFMEELQHGNQNTTEQACLLEKPITEIINHRNTINYWIILPGVTFIHGMYVIIVAGLEFLCAQTPYGMKGLVLSCTYSILGVNYLLGSATITTIAKELTKIKEITVGCLFVFLLCSILLAVTLFVIFLVVKYKYKLRLREDHPPSLQYFAERYYDPDYNTSD